MANRPIFLSTHNPKKLFKEKNIEFTFFNGFSLSQKSKSINSLHQSANEAGFNKVLEVSTKSDSKIGWALSAFNLMVDFDGDKEISLECAFQGSKVFEDNIQYKDIYLKTSIEAKKDTRLRTSGNIIGFEFEGNFWKNEPKTAFYDWMYINALYKNHRDIVDELLEYEAFSDIEFNPKKSINCQARTCAVLVSLVRLDLIDEALKSPEKFIEVVYGVPLVQGSLF
ncbi:MAG: FIG01245625: hypothetical protein [uncultured Sulfurovum sp.]|uniref:Uncharacterized protein n=1 Tax=uncultured Sulfurovum sp. TaxID=269237 RepID=A0A6S6S2Q6_9BACT|nr:MAG: FIG01245625: hypothetical protein [uncultured Sulfurovum sp.]